MTGYATIGDLTALGIPASTLYRWARRWTPHTHHGRTVYPLAEIWRDTRVRNRLDKLR